MPPEDNGERHKAKVTRKVVRIIDQENDHRIENINFILDIGSGKVEELISYNQLLDHLETTQDNDLGIDQELFKFRAIIGDQGPLKATDPDSQTMDIRQTLRYLGAPIGSKSFLSSLNICPSCESMSGNTYLQHTVVLF